MADDRSEYTATPDAERISQAEEIIRSLNKLIDAMYNSDLEAVWPRGSGPLMDAYQERYGVELT